MGKKRELTVATNNYVTILDNRFFGGGLSFEFRNAFGCICNSVYYHNTTSNLVLDA